MGDFGLTDQQLDALFSCYAHERRALSIAYASAALFFYDYLLTFSDELRFIWEPRRISLGSVAFFFARYLALACTILILADSQNILSENVATGLKLVAIISSELILTIRTWAIWEKSRKILALLVSISICAIVPAAIIVAKDVQTTKLGPPIAPQLSDLNHWQCRVVVSAVKHAYIIPYAVTIAYETVTLVLSLCKILQWRKKIPDCVKTPLIDTIWKDGLLYFSWMIALGFANIGLVLQTSSPQLRTACAQLQMAVHSILSTRIVLHLASLQDSRGSGNLGHSALTDTGIQFTSRINTSLLSDSIYEV